MSKRFKQLLSLGLVLADILLINVAFAISYWMRYDLQWFRAVDPAFDASFSAYIPFAGVLTALLLIAYKLEGVYDHRRGASWFDEFYSVLNGTTTGIVIMIVVTFIYRPLVYSRLLFGYTGVLIVALLGFSRLVKSIVLQKLRKRGIGVVRTLIVGAGEVGRTIMRNIVAQPGLGYQVVGFVDDNPEKGHKDIGRFKGLGSIDNLPRIAQDESIDEVIITLPWMYHRKIISIMTQCEREGVRARLVPDIFQMSLSRMDVDDLGGVPMIGVKEISITGGKLAAKRAIDFTVALVGLIVSLPLTLLIALAIKLDSPGPVLFRQIRVGKGGRHFVLYKFRSMCEGAEDERQQLTDLNEAEGPIFKIRHDPRCTRAGRFLRRTSLDELPQLYNVLRGEMSLVGPRPPVPAEVEHYEEWHKKRLEVSPGMTGLWQVSGRSELSFDEMVLLDIYYIENWSAAMDTEIFLRTIPKVIFGEGAY
ncbi:MAG: undecaprenyl-phosphate glucose phosphotransferase [Anaerolineae bacterium]